MLHFIESFAEKRLNTNSLLSDGITYQDYVNSVAYNKRLHTMGRNTRVSSTIIILH